MRNKWVLSCVVLLMMASTVFAQPQELTGRDILESSARAYAELNHYVGTTSSVSRLVVQKNKKKAYDLPTASFARIEFNRNGKSKVDLEKDSDKEMQESEKIKIQGTGLIDMRYSLTSNGKTGTVMYGGLEGKEVVHKDLDIVAAIGMTAGMSGGAASLVPHALFGLGGPLTTLHSPQLQGIEKIGFWDCYKITDFDPIHNIQSTFWVDRKSFLLRQYQKEQGEINLDAAKDKNSKFRESLEETQQFMKKTGIKSITTLQIIGIEKAQ